MKDESHTAHLKALEDTAMTAVSEFGFKHLNDAFPDRGTEPATREHELEIIAVLLGLAGGNLVMFCSTASTIVDGMPELGPHLLKQMDVNRDKFAAYVVDASKRRLLEAQKATLPKPRNHRN